MSTWREQLAFAPLETLDRGEEVGTRLRHAIELGVLEDGYQLPSESELAAQMCVSTLTLRAALAELRGRGLLETRRGKGGGSFIKANTGAIARAEHELLMAYSLEDLKDIREYWAAIAGSAAAVAADRSDQLSLGRLMSLAMKIESATDHASSTRADSRFHLELAASSGSLRLTRQEMAVQSEVGPLIWASPSGLGSTAAEHAAIVEAIGSGDKPLARALTEAHVRSDMNRVLDRRMSQAVSLKESPLDADQQKRELSLATSFLELLAETALFSLRSIEHAVRAQLVSRHQGASSDLESIYTSARQALERAVPLLYGAGFLPDSDFFPTSGIAWCYAPSGSQSLQRLVIDWDFYDVDAAAWRPDQEGGVHVSPAYLDVAGSNENIVTFSKEVLVDDRPVGIVAVDVLVSAIQAQIESHLQALPPNTCLVDQKGVIMATNTGHFVGGIYSASNDGGEQLDLTSVPWKLFLGTTNAQGALHPPVLQDP